MVEFNIDGNAASADSGDSSVEPEETLLIGLKKRRAQIVNEMFTDIKVPRWESPEIYVRFKPVSATKLNATIERRRKMKGDDWSFLANADMLVDSCIGIYAVMDGDTDNKLSLRLGDPKGEWTKFDTDLAEALGVEVTRAVDACTSLYLTEGDLIDTSNRLFKWSNISSDEADETF